MTMETPLELQLAKARQQIASDGYPMSVGELTNLYRDGELIIRPEFQRFFRWTQVQKARLVESLLLGIPLPSIFVAQTERGIWEVVDGLQRLSTIFELQGELRSSDGNLVPPLELKATKYLPDLEGKFWVAEDLSNSLTDAQRLDIKRSKIDIKIIKRESSTQTKFDLFQRLNSYGTQLNAQEMRSALLVAASPEFFSRVERLASLEDFRASVSLSEKQIEERYDLELVTRFLVLHNWPSLRMTATALRDLPQILDDASVELATSYPDGFEDLETVFEETFRIIAANGDEDALRRWDPAKQEVRGPFLTSAFEIIALGLAYNIRAGIPYRTDLLQVAKELWSLPKMQSGYSTGRSTESRLAEFLPLGRDLLAKG
ncbi:DUF262 domain-containing protein [uncultured Brevundimonas sp.]|uniref:DUF262 domain-containing protein n=1 Tax=uncultured Brevundimonas sp. TaxID=213418 RepID=UPI002600E48F|nr:DUF262 domain-containing protein [uncultured Brevundimonas sp.]